LASASTEENPLKKNLPLLEGGHLSPLSLRRLVRDPLPSADVLTMGHILHDWDLDQKRTLLEKAYAALPKGGALIVFEALIDDERQQNAFGLLMSLNM
jgi:hypothetical protein